MNQKEFEQRLKNLSRSAIDALEKTFGKSLTSVKEFYEKLSSMTKEARADVVKTVGVATLAVVMGVSMAGCQETTPPTDTTQIESSADETEKGTILDETTIGTETIAPDETTQENTGETTIASAGLNTTSASLPFISFKFRKKKSSVYNGN